MLATSKLHIMQVRSYDLFLDIDFNSLKFEGRALVELESEGDVTLNAVDLKIRNVNVAGKPLKFTRNDDNLVIKTGHFKGKLEIRYTGVIPDTMVGIYRAPYGNTHMITTQFEAASARRMFPCADHPGYKAKFKLTLRINKDLDAISNTLIESVKIEEDKKLISFQTTPRMSTYLLYVGIGKFDERRNRFAKIDFIAATQPGKASKVKFALEVAKKSIAFYRIYFNMPYTLPKLHLITVPEFAAGAMENWGAITFREAALLVDENSSVRTKKRVAEIVAHEVAHQWFGNLVTMKWWDDLWLNESFATLMGYKVVDKFYPQWKIWQDFFSSETSGAMTRDSLRNTHQIQVKIESPTDIEQFFDDISYGKGASILRMIEAYVGPEDFRKGIRTYLNRYKFSNATGKDLWNSLEEASGKQVKRIMREWIETPGYPVVTACLNEGKLILVQERFLISGRSEKHIWPVPVVMTLNGKIKRILLDKEKKTIAIKNLRSLNLNVDRTGFYRVNYKGLYDLVWKSKLTAFDRWGLIFDAVAFLVSGKIDFEDYLNLVKQYYREPDYLPADETSAQLRFLYIILQSKVAKVSKEFHRSQLKLLQGKQDENSSMLRGNIATRLAMVDEDYAKELGAKFLNYEKVNPDMREAVATAYAVAYNNFDEMLRKYRESKSDEEKIRLLGAMTSFKEKTLIAQSLGLALSNEVKKQDVATIILAATRNPNAKNLTWTWMKDNMGRLRKLYEGTGRLSRILLSTIPILGIGRVGEVESFFKENVMPEAGKGIEAGLERLKIYDRFVKRHIRIQ